MFIMDLNYTTTYMLHTYYVVCAVYKQTLNEFVYQDYSKQDTSHMAWRAIKQSKLKFLHIHQFVNNLLESQ